MSENKSDWMWAIASALILRSWGLDVTDFGWWTGAVGLVIIYVAFIKRKAVE